MTTTRESVIVASIEQALRQAAGDLIDVLVAEMRRQDRAKDVSPIIASGGLQAGADGPTFTITIEAKPKFSLPSMSNNESNDRNLPRSRTDRSPEVRAQPDFPAWLNEAGAQRPLC